MKRKKHHIVAIFLLLLTLAPTLLMGGLQAFRFYIRQRMERALDKEALTTISLPAASVVWYEEGREIRVDGRMFDIKTFSIEHGTLTAQGVYDDDETEVVNLMNGHWSERGQQHLVVQLLVLSHCVLAIQLFRFLFTSFAVRNILATAFLAFYPAPVLPIAVPPPRRF